MFWRLPRRFLTKYLFLRVGKVDKKMIVEKHSSFEVRKCVKYGLVTDFFRGYDKAESPIENSNLIIAKREIPHVVDIVNIIQSIV